MGLYESFGGLTLPLSVTGNPDGMSGLDPARTVLLDLFAAAINDELGPRWALALGGMTGENAALRDSTPVSYKLELPPTPGNLQQVKVAWPLLALHRDGPGEYSQHTLCFDKLTQQWQLHYILGPLGIEDVRRFGDACVAASKIIRRVIRQHGHPAYEDGAVQFGAGKGDLATVELKSHEGPGQASLVGDQNNTLYYAITFNIETTELGRDNAEAFGELDGGSFDFSIGGGEGTIPGLLYADTDANG